MPLLLQKVGLNTKAAMTHSINQFTFHLDNEAMQIVSMKMENGGFGNHGVEIRA